MNPCNIFIIKNEYKIQFNIWNIEYVVKKDLENRVLKTVL